MDEEIALSTRWKLIIIAFIISAAVLLTWGFAAGTIQADEAQNLQEAIEVRRLYDSQGATT